MSPNGDKPMLVEMNFLDFQEDTGSARSGPTLMKTKQ